MPSCLIHEYRAGFHHRAHVVDGQVDVGQRVAFDGDEIGKVTRRGPILVSS
jgi:hypothetical protein